MTTNQPKPFVPLSAHDLELRKSYVAGVKDAQRQLIRWLLRNAQEPERVYKRVLQLDYVLRKDEQREQQKELAKRLNVGSTRCSIAISEAEGFLQDMQNRTSRSKPNEEPGNCAHI